MGKVIIKPLLIKVLYIILLNFPHILRYYILRKLPESFAFHKLLSFRLNAFKKSVKTTCKTHMPQGNH